MNLNPEHVAWQKNLLSLLKIGGRWGVPKNGAVLIKLSDSKVSLTGADDDLTRDIKAHCEAAGYEVKFVAS